MIYRAFFRNTDSRYYAANKGLVEAEDEATAKAIATREIERLGRERGRQYILLRVQPVEVWR